MSLTQTPYFNTILNFVDYKGYRAAGVLAFRRVKRNDRYETEFLFGRESSKNPTKFNRLNILGGKIENSDETNPCITAAREFTEETGKLLGNSQEYFLNIRLQQNGVLWFPSAKYALYIYELTSEDEFDIVETYDREKQKLNGKNLFKNHNEMFNLVWIKGDVLLSYLLDYTKDKVIMATNGIEYLTMNFSMNMLGTECMIKKLKKIINNQLATCYNESNVINF